MPAPGDAVIWTYWAEPTPGRRSRPPYMDACLETALRNAECPVIVASPDNVSEYAPDLHPAFPLLTPNHQSDVFRANVLCRYGGMWMDCDTVVMESLRPLFELLSEYEVVGADWKPTGQPFGISVMGPCRPNLPFLARVKERQNEILDGKYAALRDGSYPLFWEELMGAIITAAFLEHPPVALIKDGVSTWGAFAASPEHAGGSGGHPLKHTWEVSIPSSELFTFWNSTMPEHVRTMEVDKLLDKDWILSELLRRALGRHADWKPGLTSRFSRWAATAWRRLAVAASGG